MCVCVCVCEYVLCKTEIQGLGVLQSAIVCKFKPEI